MNTNTAITVICFSPTHTSKTIAEAVATGMARARCGSEGNAEASASCSMLVRTIDLTLDRSDEPITLTSGETVVLGAPVYAGRVAPEAVRRLKRIQVAAGASIPAVITVTYGNRDYEDALVELYDLALSLGLTPFAAGAFIGEHSYSTPEPSSESTATALPRCLLPKDAPTPWTWPMPASSEESAPANWKALEHSHLSTSRETVRTKNHPVRRPPLQPHIPPVPVRLPSLQHIPPSLQVQTDLPFQPYP